MRSEYRGIENAMKITTALRHEVRIADFLPFVGPRRPFVEQINRARLVMEQELTDRQRETIALACEGRTVREIADLQGVCASTACRTLHRGIRKMRRYLQY